MEGFYVPYWSFGLLRQGDTSNGRTECLHAGKRANRSRSLALPLAASRRARVGPGYLPGAPHPAASRRALVGAERLPGISTKTPPPAPPGGGCAQNPARRCAVDSPWSLWGVGQGGHKLARFQCAGFALTRFLFLINKKKRRQSAPAAISFCPSTLIRRLAVQRMGWLRCHRRTGRIGNAGTLGQGSALSWVHPARPFVRPAGWPGAVQRLQRPRRFFHHR